MMRLRRMGRALRRRFGRSSGPRDDYRGISIFTSQNPNGGWSYRFDYHERVQSGGRRTGYATPWKAIAAAKDHVDQVMR